MEHDPSWYRGGVETLGFIRRALEGGGTDSEVRVPDGAVVHAEWERRPRRPPTRLLATRADEHHEAWCGVRLRLLLPERFNAGSVRACPDCLKAFERGFPEALVQS